MTLGLANRLSAVCLVLLLGAFSGCASNKVYAPKGPYMYYHEELPAAERAVEAARAAGKDKECPEDFAAAEKMKNDAYEIYWSCRTEEGIAMANRATAAANALCPKKAGAPKMAPVAPQAAPVPAPKAEVRVIHFEDVHFDFDKSTLTEEARGILDRSIRILNENPNANIRIAGYASASGTNEYNQKLSERRAKAVLDYLIKEGGVAPGRLTTIGYGEDRPATYEPSPADINSKAAKSNMRVLLEVIVK